MRGEKKKETVFLFSKKGVTQGCPLTMVGYMLLIFPLNGKLKKEFSDVEPPWYADDGAAAARLKTLI